MTILIKGIDLPKGARYADISFLDKFGIPVGHGYIEEAIQIPTPHGRLIDADALDLEREVDLADDWKTAHEIANCVKYAPTILEAEE